MGHTIGRWREIKRYVRAETKRRSHLCRAPADAQLLGEQEQRGCSSRAKPPDRLVTSKPPTGLAAEQLGLARTKRHYSWALPLFSSHPSEDEGTALAAEPTNAILDRGCVTPVNGFVEG